jgi:hypothetical protein
MFSTEEAQRLLSIIADKIEDNTLFNAGILSKRKIAETVRIGSTALQDITLLCKPRKRKEYHKNMGPVLWWNFPVTEAPYVGTPLDTDFPDYKTHWTPLPTPKLR